MAYAPRQYGMVPIPQQGGSPLSTLSDLMQLQRQIGAMNDEGKARQTKTRIESALNTGKGDPIEAAKLLEGEGDFTNARLLRDKASEIRLKSVDDMHQRLDQHKTVFGQGAQMLKEVEARPDLYPEVRPRLMELAASLDPNLAKEIPEAYEPEKIRGLLQFAQGAAEASAIRQRGLVTLKEALAQTDDSVKRTDGYRKSLSDWLSTATTAAEWDATKQHAGALGIPSSVVDEFGAWDDKARDRAREKGLTPEQREVAARAGIDDKRADATAKETERNHRVMEGIARQREARLKTTDAGGITPAARATAERWKSDQLEQLEREFADRSPTWEDGTRIPPIKPEMSVDQLRQRQLAIENSYRAQVSLPALKTLPASWTGGEATPPPAPAVAPKAPVAAAGKQTVPSDMVGKTVTLKDGRQVKVKAVYADGSFDPE